MNVASAEETGLLNEEHSSVADDMLLLNAEKVETSSYHMENLHEVSRLVEEDLGEVSSSTNLGEMGYTHCELIPGSVNLSDADVEGGMMESNLYGVGTEVPFSATQGELHAEEKENLQKVASQPVVYDHFDSRVIDMISNSHSESESSLLTDVTASSTFEQNGSQENVVLAEKHTLDADSVNTETRVYKPHQCLSIMLWKKKESNRLFTNLIM